MYRVNLFYSLDIKPNDVGSGRVKNMISLEELKSNPATLKNEQVYDFFRGTRYIPQINYDVMTIYHLSTTIDSYKVEVTFSEFLNTILITSTMLCDPKIVNFIDRHIKIFNNLLNPNWHNFNMSLLIEELVKDRIYDLLPPSIPMKTKLYDYQVDNINWMKLIETNPVKGRITDHRVINFPNGRFYDYSLNAIVPEDDIEEHTFKGGIIADEMGIGKTLQMLTHCFSTHGVSTLIVVPNHLKLHWQNEIGKHFDFSPEFIQINSFGEFIQNKTSIVFARIVVDEIHETYSNPENLQVFNRLVEYPAQYKWGISGTPFAGTNSLFHIIKYLTGKEFFNFQIERMYRYQHIYLRIFRRNTIEHAQKFINLPPANFTNKLLTFTTQEMHIYEAEVQAGNNADVEFLRKCCCNVMRQYFSNNCNELSEKEIYTIVLQSFEKKWISAKENCDHFKEQIHHATQCIESMMSTEGCDMKHVEAIKMNIVYYQNMLLKHEEITNNRFQSYQFLKTQIESDKSCPICISEIDKEVGYCLFPCSHIVCIVCAKLWCSINHTCPFCRNNFEISQLTYVTNHESRRKYNTKISAILDVIQASSDKFLLYTQYDFMVEEFEKIFLKENISSIIYHKDLNIFDFRDLPTKCMIISSKQNASGLDLSFVKNIIIVEPVIGSLNFLRDTERQIIGRIYRINQTESVNIHRLIIRNTIEEQIYSEL